MIQFLTHILALTPKVLNSYALLLWWLIHKYKWNKTNFDDIHMDVFHLKLLTYRWHNFKGPLGTQCSGFELKFKDFRELMIKKTSKLHTLYISNFIDYY